MNKEKNLHIFAYAAQGKGISGGDRIFIEIARRVSKKNKVYIHLSDEGYKMCKGQDLTDGNIVFDISELSKYRKLGYFFFYLSLVFTGFIKGLKLKIRSNESLLYSASEFWMDTLPAIVLKVRNRQLKWISSWYQTAPSPISGFASRYRTSSLPYWLVQKSVKPFISLLADYICVNNKNEKKIFPKNKTFVMYGAIDVEKIRFFRNKLNKLEKVYDAVFQGRFHPQKGVVELIEIWKKVATKIPNAKLVMIGDGPLMKSVKAKIEELGLEENISLPGFVFDGEDKYKIFAQSKIVVHPSFYDSGGMAAGEAMAFGLPAVAFDLSSYKDYYPKGMVKIRKGNLDTFAETIVKLLENKKLREESSKGIINYMESNWSWDKRIDDFWSFVNYG